MASLSSFEKDSEATSGLRWKDGSKTLMSAVEWEGTDAVYQASSSLSFYFSLLMCVSGSSVTWNGTF